MILGLRNLFPAKIESGRFTEFLLLITETKCDQIIVSDERTFHKGFIPHTPISLQTAKL